MSNEAANLKFAKEKREEARKLLNQLVGYPPGISGGAVERVIDCIIAAAVIEATLVVNELNKKKEQNG